MYFCEYHTPVVGTLTVTSDGEGITGCWFDNDRHFGHGLTDKTLERHEDLPVLRQAESWLDRYFAGEKPNSRDLPLAARGTEFQLLVREALLDIPYGETMAYGAIAKRLEAKTGRHQSPRAVGSAVGHNPLCVMVPCHRVVAANGSLTGFAGGIARKVALLEHENALKPEFKVPRKGTALEGVPNAALVGRGQQYRFEDLTPDQMRLVQEARDSSFAGVFFVGVTSTGVYCRPDCRAKVPMQKNCRYFPTAEDAESAGFRSCKLCHPERLKGSGS
ncbi:methylated-DNA--[protein]-cysteine S-methyltransferase [Olsenella sp. Marseille-P4559]|uniref:methylated-DNA--[protein]-cysteine S-methyltransferase n=1 Tax=Olsenella sp. Marseille-P4559 TaxID=2364795 RepID=UPI0010321A7D|nr:methylated-DNA--[protein]-cysteine S-methyltransferase [Olsenella sp. Marseille-P4559]